MKIRISNSPPIDGYIHVCPAEGGNFYTLPCEQASLFELIAEDILNYIPLPALHQTLTAWISCLRHQGRITLTGVDSLEAARRYVIGELSTEEFNRALYGSQSASWEFRSSCIPLPDLVNILVGGGLKIMRKRLDGHNYLVEAIRP